MSADPTAFAIDFDPRQQRMSGIAVHGNTPFDVPFVSAITDDLWVGGCTNGLVLPQEVSHLVSLYPWESYTVAHDLRTMTVVRQYDSIDDLDETQMFALADWVNACRKTGVVLVHCQAGLNRSNRLAALALIRSGMTPDEAISLLRAKRSPAVLCNPAFELWLRGLGREVPDA